MILMMKMKWWLVLRFVKIILNLCVYYSSVSFQFILFFQALALHPSDDEFSPEEDGISDDRMKRHDYSDVSSVHSDDTDNSQRESTPAVTGVILVNYFYSNYYQSADRLVADYLYRLFPTFA